MSETILIAGLNQEGLTLYNFLKTNKNIKVYGLDYDNKEVWQKLNPKIPKANTVDTLYIMLPYSDTFIVDATAYIDLFQPRKIVIAATLPFEIYMEIIDWAITTDTQSTIEYDSRMQHRFLEEYEW